MYTIEGIKGDYEAVLLLLLHNKSNLQLYFKLESQSINEVKRVFDNTKKIFGDTLFSQIFNITLTDYAEENTIPKFCLRQA